MGPTTSEAERTKTVQLDLHTKRIALDCGCGEKVVIFGKVGDWLPRDPVFRCACGEGLTFSEDAKKEYYASLKAS
jgi:hypothetical protein